jgi:hypothetical protein
MKHFIVLTLVIVATAFVSGCSDSDVEQTAVPSLHYSQNAPDLIDVCRFDASLLAGDPETFNLVTEVDTAAETLGAALDTDSQIRVLVKKKAAVGETQIYSDNYLIQVATETGIKTVMARMDATYEAELFALDEAALYALPFRLMVIPNGSSMVHICMVDPVAYLRQFTPVSNEVAIKLNEAVAHFQSIIQETFANAFFDPQKQTEALASPQNLVPVITLGQVSATLNSVYTALSNGTFYYNGTAFKSGLDAFANNDGKDDCEDIFILYEDLDNRPSIEIRGFVPFSTFKDFRKSSTFNIVNMTDTMAFLVQNSIIHIFDFDRRQIYDVNGKTVYQCGL